MPGVNLEAARARLAAVRKAQEERDNRTKFFKLKDGKNFLRLMPPLGEDGEWCVEAKYHYNVHPKAAFLCLKTFNEACPICENVDLLFANKDEEDIKEAKKIWAKTRFIANIFNLDEKGSGKVELFGFGPDIHTKILEYFSDPDYGDFSDPKTGRDIKIEKTGKGMQTEYTVHLRPAVSVFEKWDSVKSQLNDLRKHVEGDKKPYEVLKGILEGTLNPDGSSTTGQSSPAKSEEGDDGFGGPEETPAAETGDGFGSPEPQKGQAQVTLSDPVPSTKTEAPAGNVDPKMAKLRDTLNRLKKTGTAGK